MHKSVLLEEVIENLNIHEDGIYVDCTLGYGGHSSEILKRIKTGYLYGFDQDDQAIEFSSKRLSAISDCFQIIHANFKDLKKCMDEIGVSKVDGILLDLGFSSPQIDDAERGFSFMKDAHLDMRMDRRQKMSAFDIVNSYNVADLTDIFYRYAEEKFSKVIASAIVKNRPINTTMELVEVIKGCVPKKYFLTRHPERVIFQAIRIEVNHELDYLKEVLPQAVDMLKPNGRMCVITFHSLEDRIVKKFFKCESEIDPLVKGLPNIPLEYRPHIKVVNKKPILPTEEEIKENSRSKSAKLRVIERVD